MVVQCDVCDGTPTSNDDKYYLIRISNSGLDFTDGMTDHTLCGSCLVNKIDTSTNRGKIQSILRIENPMMG